MIFGGVDDEEILVNESTIWCGPPTPTDNPGAPELISQMRELLFAGKNAEAESICRNQFLEPDSDGERRSFQPLGFIHLEHRGLGETEDYRRELSFNTATARTTFRSQGTSYKREAFVSEPDQVLVCEYTADKAGAVSFEVTLTRPSGATVTATSDRLRLTGRAAAENGEFPGTSFQMTVTARTEGGSVEVVGDRLLVSGAESATLLVSAATDYNFEDPKTPQTQDLSEACDEALALVNAMDMNTLRQRHVDDFKALYEASALRLTATTSSLPINERVMRASEGTADSGLLLLYFAYARYVFISASRYGGLPVNLQGLWNPLMQAPWRSDLHLNINIQEAYWFAEQGALPTCHEPLFSLLENLLPNGQEAARVMMGVPRGFLAGVRSDGTLCTTPAQQPVWGMYVAGAAWCAQHVMEHYPFTQDKDFLKRRGFRILRENALFWMDWLVPDPKTGRPGFRALRLARKRVPPAGWGES